MQSRSHLFAPACASVIAAAGFIGTLALLSPASSFAQTPTSTQSLRAGSAAAKKLPKAPSFMTREERLRAKPLNPKATSGKPVPVRLTKAELEELKNAKPAQSRGGAPNPNAKKLAKKQFPNDWNLSR